MKFDLGNILYIAVTVIAILASLLRKRKKKQEQGKSTSRPGFMDTLERFLSQGQEEPMVMNLQGDEQDIFEEEYVTDDVAAPSEHLSSVSEAERLNNEYQEILKRLSAREGEFGLGEGTDVREAMALSDMEEEDATDYFEIVKDFDAGTAVVYSAIINRVDY